MAKQISSVSEAISVFQMREDEILYSYFKLKDEAENLIKEVEILSQAQDYCSFNVFWAVGISPIFLRVETFEFMVENKSEIKRKLTLKEVVSIDFNIRYIKPENFQDLKKKLSAINQ